MALLTIISISILKLINTNEDSQFCRLPQTVPESKSAKLEGINVLSDKSQFFNFAQLRVDNSTLLVMKNRLSSAINLTCNKGKTIPNIVKTVDKSDRFF